MNTGYENIFLVHSNILVCIGWNIFSTESQKMLEIMRGWGQKIRQTKNKTNSFAIWVKSQQFESAPEKWSPLLPFYLQ